MSRATARPEPARLGAVALFAGLPAAELGRLSGLLRLEEREAGASLLFRGQPGTTVYVLLEGTLKVHAAQPDGKQVILAVLGPGEVVGELSAVDSLGRSATVTALEPCTLLVMDGDSFRDCLRSWPALARNLVLALSRRLRLANVQLQALAGLDADGRLARQLLAFAAEYGEDAGGGAVRIPLRLTQEDLASLIGVTRVRVNQVLGDVPAPRPRLRRLESAAHGARPRRAGATLRLKPPSPTLDGNTTGEGDVGTEGSEGGDAAERLSGKLQELYDSLPEDEQALLAAVLAQAQEEDVGGFSAAGDRVRVRVVDTPYPDSGPSGIVEILF